MMDILDTRAVACPYCKRNGLYSRATKTTIAPDNGNTVTLLRCPRCDTPGGRQRGDDDGT